MPVADTHLIWIDLEMTGLDTQNDYIIEIATVVTDADLSVLAEGPVIAIHQEDEILAGMDHPSKAIVERRRGLAIRRAIAIAGRDDLVLVAGKGHETVQDLGDRKVHFSDRAQVQQALGERIWAPALEVVA